MFLALISTFITGISDIFWKKSLGYGVPSKLHQLLSYPIGLFIFFYFIYIGIDYTKIDSLLLIGTISIFLIDTIKTTISQKIYREDKISTVIPYTNINKILSIIFSFFIFADVSLISLIITIFAILIIILSSINFKTFKTPKNFFIIILSELLGTLIIIGSGYLILKYSEILYFNIYVILGICILTLISLSLGEFKTLKGLKKDFWIYRYIGGLGWISWFMSLVVIKNLGLSITILLSFLGIGLTLFLSFIIFKDKPTKKDLLLTIIVTAFVGIGFYLK